MASKRGRKFTYQARITGDCEVLAAHGELYGRLDRKLFASWHAGNFPASLEAAYIREFDLPSVMSNALRVPVKGKVDSVQAIMGLRMGG